MYKSIKKSIFPQFKTRKLLLWKVKGNIIHARPVAVKNKLCLHFSGINKKRCIPMGCFYFLLFCVGRLEWRNWVLFCWQWEDLNTGKTKNGEKLKKTAKIDERKASFGRQPTWKDICSVNARTRAVNFYARPAPCWRLQDSWLAWCGKVFGRGIKVLFKKTKRQLSLSQEKLLFWKPWG